MSVQGKLFVFEGMDSVGKTTLSKGLAKWLSENNGRTEWLSFPGRRPHSIGALFYDIHHNPERFEIEQFTPLANQFLHLAAHVDAVDSVILPALSSGIHVVLDRFWWSALIYGPKDERSKAALLRAIEAEKCLWGKVQPDALFLLTRACPFEMECESEGWIELQRDYLALAADQAANHPIHVIENLGTLSSTLNAVTRRVSDLLQTNK
jgi:thymidylate kinase